MEYDLIQSGLTSFMDENYTTAVDQFSKSIEKNQNNYEAYFYRALTYLKIGNIQSAIADLNSANNLKGDNFDILYNMAKAHLMNMDFAQAKKELEAIQTEGLPAEQIKKIDLLRSKISF